MNAREADFQADLMKAAKLMGLAIYHTFDSRRSNPGFPDLTIVGANGILFRELKTDRGKTTPAQDYWLACLNEAGYDAKVWRPRDSQLIVEELSRLGRLITRPPEPTQAEVRKALARRGGTRIRTGQL